jgi:hypothetical protein
MLRQRAFRHARDGAILKTGAFSKLVREFERDPKVNNRVRLGVATCAHTQMLHPCSFGSLGRQIPPPAPERGRRFRTPTTCFYGCPPTAIESGLAPLIRPQYRSECAMRRTLACGVVVVGVAIAASAALAGSGVKSCRMVRVSADVLIANVAAPVRQRSRCAAASASTSWLVAERTVALLRGGDADFRIVGLEQESPDSDEIAARRPMRSLA